MNKFQQATLALAAASSGNPVISTLVVMLFYGAFNFVEAVIERHLFGESFEHFLDAGFALAFIGYAAYAVYWCAVFNKEKRGL